MNYNNLFFTGIFLLLFSAVNAQDNVNAIDTYFQQYVEDERFSVVYVSPRLFQMIGSIGSSNLDLNEKEADAFIDMASDLRGLRILSTDINPQEYFNEFKSKIQTKIYEPLITVREKDGGKLEFYIKETQSGIIEELLFFSFSEEDFTFMSFVGPLQLNKILRLAEEMENN